jgi:hypothetical protein
MNNSKIIYSEPSFKIGIKIVEDGWIWAGCRRLVSIDMEKFRLNRHWLAHLKLGV